jgi:hypothetical protein
MPLNKLENFLKNVEGRILYVSPADLDSTDSILNQGNSQTKPFKTLQRALIEAARFSYNVGRNNDTTEKTTILLMPGEHEIDNRPGHSIRDDGTGIVELRRSDGTEVNKDSLTLTLESNFDISQEDNILYKFNSVNGGVIVPRGTSIVGLDLRKTKIRPKYVPNPTDDTVPYSALFRITGACYFWQFSIFDGSELGKVYTDDKNFVDVINQVQPTFSHHKLTCFEYADGVNEFQSTGLTDLDMYYYKLSRAYNQASNRNIDEKFLIDGAGTGLDGFAKQRAEWEIVGAFADDPLKITSIQSGTLPGVPTNQVTVTTQGPHNLSNGTPIKIKGVSRSEYNISTKVSATDPVNNNIFTYTLPDFPVDLETEPAVDSALVTIETDTVSGASPYIFNISLRSVWGMQGMHADGSKASGFRSMVVAQFTGVSLQKDDRAFVKYNVSSRAYESLSEETTKGGKLALESSSTNTAQVYHLDSEAIYRNNWQTTHVKITNDAILQVVSVFAIGYTKHFEARSGGDASITNSNSNFGQLALVADGFRKDAFKKDDNAFITHIIAPKAITTAEEDVEWVQLSTTKDSNTNRLYLFGYDSENIKPPSLTQGFRVGAKNNDKLYVNNGKDENGNIKVFEADIKMSNSAGSSARRSVDIGTIDGINGKFTTPDPAGADTSPPHGFALGEKVIVIADGGDLPEKIEEHKVYFVISGVAQGLTNAELKLALSESDAENGVAIKNTYISDTDATKIKIISRVTDKESGDVGHPVQYDETNGWYITTNDNSAIREELDNVTGSKTEISYFKRIADTRSLDDKIFKTRVSIPKEVQNGKNIQNGFILQESSQTGVRTDGDLNFESEGGTLTASDFAYKRNPRFISSCTFNSGTGKVTVVSERPHNLQTNDLVRIDAIRHSLNTEGTAGKGYNVEASVTVVDNMTFTYNAPVTISTPPTNDFTLNKTQLVGSASSLPTFTRKDLKSNLYFFRNDVISEYDEGVETGVYHGYQLFADLAVPEEFTDNKYGQTVVDLYPQLDRDNVNDTPRAAKSFALRAPLGKVVTNDLQKSITRESTDKLLLQFGRGIEIDSFADSTTSGVITLNRSHNLGGLALIGNNKLSNDSAVTAPDGTYENVKIYEDEVSAQTWNGALGKVTISGNQITAYEITNPGSGFPSDGSVYAYWDSAIVGGPTNTGGARLGSSANAGLTNAVLTSSHENLVIQVTGSGITTDAYFRTTSVPQPNQIGIAKTAGDPNITSDQYVFVVGNALDVQYSVSNGTVTFTTQGTNVPHGLKKGNRFQINDDNDNNLETLIVEDVSNTAINQFTAKSTILSGTDVDGHVLKHGLSANDEDTGKDDENLSVRGVPLYGLERAKLTSTISAAATEINLSLLNSQQGAGIRFPQGSYIQIDDEILRIASSTATVSSGTLSGTIVIRGVFGTRATQHSANSLVQKLNPIPLELHRYSILRASGHTFEYLGYGPGNYSTALPQVQVRTLTEREEFLSQAQELSAGSVVYTGMNDKGDFYIGNQKKSALTGEETTFDNPVPTVAGEDPSRLSVVFDEVTIKERLVVEGGKSNNILSQFDGPVTFTSDVRHKGKVKIKDDTNVGDGDGALVVEGGVDIGKDLNVDNDLDVGNDLTVDDNLIVKGNTTLGDANTDTITLNAEFDSSLIPAGSDKNIGSNTDQWNDIYINGTAYIDTLRVEDTTDNTLGDVNTGSAQFDGGVGIAKKLTVGMAVTSKDLIYADEGFRLAQNKDLAMGSEHKFKIFENTDGNGTIKHGGDSGNLGITVKAGNTISFGSNGTANAAQFTAGSGCKLKFGGNKKLETVTGGVTVTGTLTADDITVDNVTINDNTVTATNFSGTATQANKPRITGANTALNRNVGIVCLDETPENATTGSGTYQDLKATAGLRFNLKDSILKINGDIIAFASDERLKTNISPITEALSKVKSIDGFTYNFNDTAKELGFDTEVDYAGVSAQKVQKVLPEVVRPAPSSDDYITVQYEKLVPLLIEAIKELSDKVDDLEQKLSDK